MTDKIQKSSAPFSLDGLRRRARALRKAQGIPHHEALRAVAVEAGYTDWHAAQTTLKRQKLRVMAAANYAIATPTGPIEKRVNSYRYTQIFRPRGIRPPKRMPVAQHKECGSLLGQILWCVYERVAVRHRVDAMRATLETWLNFEVGDELTGRAFFDVYYGGAGGQAPYHGNPAAYEKELYEKLEAVRAILRNAYPNCTARDILLNDIDQAKRLIALWIAGPRGTKRGPRAVRPAIPAPNAQLATMDSAQSLNYAIDRLSLFIERFESRWKRPGYRYAEEMRQDFPYAIKEVADGTYILLNREYKPVGWNTRDWVKYEEVTSKHLKLTQHDLRSVLPGDRQMGLYDDGTTPWRKRRDAILYLGRLKHLRGILGGTSQGQVAA